MQLPEYLPREADRARPDRRELNRMLGKLARGDMVTVTRVNRLARSTFRPVWHRQAYRGRQGAIPILGRAMGRHRHQHRALDARFTRRTYRSNPHSHRRRQKLRQGPRKSHGPPTFPQHRRGRKWPPDAARGALRCRNWPTATTVALPPCAARRRPPS
jgi:hypothetical protein